MPPAYTREEKIAAERRFLRSLLLAVRVAGNKGKLASAMHAPVAEWITPDQLYRHLGVLVKHGCLERRGDLYFWRRDLPDNWPGSN